MEIARTLAITPRVPNPLDLVRWQDMLELIQRWYRILDRALNETEAGHPT
jgi:hypothetical protein